MTWGQRVASICMQESRVALAASVGPAAFDLRVGRPLCAVLGGAALAARTPLGARGWQVALDAAESWVADLWTGPARHRLLRLLLRLHQHADADGMIWLPRRDEIGAMLDKQKGDVDKLTAALKDA